MDEGLSTLLGVLFCTGIVTGQTFGMSGFPQQQALMPQTMQQFPGQQTFLPQTMQQFPQQSMFLPQQQQQLGQMSGFNPSQNLLPGFGSLGSLGSSMPQSMGSMNPFSTIGLGRSLDSQQQQQIQAQQAFPSQQAQASSGIPQGSQQFAPTSNADMLALQQQGRSLDPAVLQYLLNAQNSLLGNQGLAPAQTQG